MFKKALIILALGFGCQAAFAQKTFTVKNGVEFPANEISISYGGINFPEFANVLGGALGEAFTFGQVEIEDMTCSGCISLEYLRYVTPYIGVGVTAAAETFHLTFKDDKDPGNSVMMLAMPTFKASWFRKEHVGMYSKASVGACLAASKNDTNVIFAFQATPVGIEAGSTSIRGFAEFGIGFQSLLCAGVRYCF